MLSRFERYPYEHGASLEIAGLNAISAVLLEASASKPTSVRIRLIGYDAHRAAAALVMAAGDFAGERHVEVAELALEPWLRAFDEAERLELVPRLLEAWERATGGMP
jgi:hypothetical protein